MEGLEGTEISPCGRQAVLQKFTTALTRGLEQLGVTPEPGLQQRGIKSKTHSQKLRKPIDIITEDNLRLLINDCCSASAFHTQNNVLKLSKSKTTCFFFFFISCQQSSSTASILSLGHVEPVPEKYSLIKNLKRLCRLVWIRASAKCHTRKCTASPSSFFFFLTPFYLSLSLVAFKILAKTCFF